MDSGASRNDGLGVGMTVNMTAHPRVRILSAREGRAHEKVNRFPPGWDEERVCELIRHYDEQTEAEATVEDEAADEGSESGYGAGAKGADA